MVDIASKHLRHKSGRNTVKDWAIQHPTVSKKGGKKRKGRVPSPKVSKKQKVFLQTTCLPKIMIARGFGHTIVCCLTQTLFLCAAWHRSFFFPAWHRRFFYVLLDTDAFFVCCLTLDTDAFVVFLFNVLQNNSVQQRNCVPQASGAFQTSTCHPAMHLYLRISTPCCTSRCVYDRYMIHDIWYSMQESTWLQPNLSKHDEASSSRGPNKLVQ